MKRRRVALNRWDGTLTRDQARIATFVGGMTIGAIGYWAAGKALEGRPMRVVEKITFLGAGAIMLAAVPEIGEDLTSGAAIGVAAGLIKEFMFPHTAPPLA